MEHKEVNLSAFTVPLRLIPLLAIKYTENA